ncbi:MAG: hypothetical protein GY822_14350 [Deltaproteobacteria bacterium]|nr:hypothetical protein [Deltaproteobacteria bacterium]
MFGIGMTEVAIILLVALVFIGPDKLPKVARTLGKGMRELRRASDDIKSTILLDNDDEDFYRAPPPPPKRVPVADDNEVDKSAAIAGSLVAGEQVEDAEFAELSTEADEHHKNGESSGAAVENTVGRGGSSVAVTDAGKAHTHTSTSKSDSDDVNNSEIDDENDHSGMPSMEKAGLQAAKATAMHQERMKAAEAADDVKSGDVKESA